MAKNTQTFFDFDRDGIYGAELYWALHARAKATESSRYRLDLVMVVNSGEGLTVTTTDGRQMRVAEIPRSRSQMPTGLYNVTIKFRRMIFERMHELGVCKKGHGKSFPMTKGLMDAANADLGRSDAKKVELSLWNENNVGSVSDLIIETYLATGKRIADTHFAKCTGLNLCSPVTIASAPEQLNSPVSLRYVTKAECQLTQIVMPYHNYK